MKEAISTMLQTGTPDGHPLDSLVRASARYVLPVALEQEVTDFLGGYTTNAARGDKPAIARL